jgi:glycosyltransferase involved in cell wall biosynthesis
MADSVDTNRFLPRWELPDMSIVAEQKAELRLPLDRRIVVYLGLLAPYQGIDRMLQAARQLKDQNVPVHFLVMGYPNVDSYRHQAELLKVNDMVTFTGRLNYFDAPRRLVLGDIAISPKISETEGNGKLLNYAACGLPTIAYDTPVAREILGETGVFADLHSETSLAEAVRFLVEQDDARNRIGRATRLRAVERFDWVTAARGMMDLYGSLVD